MRVLFLTILSAGYSCGQFLTPDTRGTTGSEHASWDYFTQATYQWNSPDLASDSPTNNAAIVCVTPGSFLVGTGNIYNFNAPVSLELRDSANFPIQSIILQVQTLGSEIDLAATRLVPPGATTIAEHLAPTAAFVIDQEALNGDRGGLGTSYAFQWDLRDSPITGTYSLLFKGAESSVSLDKVQLDTSNTFHAITPPASGLPTPAITTAGDSILISWPENSETTLQVTATLTDEESWEAVQAAPSSSGGILTVTLPLGESPAFFRLTKQ